MTLQKDLFSEVVEVPELLTVEAEKPNKFGFFAIRSVVNKSCQIQDKKHPDFDITDGQLLALCEMRQAYIRVFRWIVPLKSGINCNEHYLSFDAIASKKGWRFQNA